MRSTTATIIVVAVFCMFFKQRVEGADNIPSGPPLPHHPHLPAGSQESKPANNPNDKSYIRLWKRKLKDGVNYEYTYHNPVKNGAINQQGSVTLFKTKDPKGGQPKATGYLISYRTSEDFSFTNPLDSDWDVANSPYYYNNNNKNTNNNYYQSPYNYRTVDTASTPYSHTYSPDHQHNRNSAYHGFQRPASLTTSPPHASEPRCYGEQNFGYNSNVIYCCMYADRPQPSSSPYPKHVCWRQHITWGRRMQ
ncbi:uncharacterized protein LOC128250619 [Octopus bimaculoides]|uniref:uncharacterized protein LOC128250619 n=1 Tax=Octopus bimaculoides TaxID=37653 RepID=UPI0022E09725|nr:uncharacterized protein LOC128250619 [Octopus bimaculoides]